MKKIILMVLAALLLLSCTKEDTTSKNSILVNNNGKPSNPSFEYKITELFKLDYIEKGIMSINDIESTINGELYLLDSRSLKIFHTDEKLKILNSFGRQGAGPGEFENAFDLNMINDSLIVIDDRLKRISLFGMDGKFIRSEAMTDNVAWVKSHNGTYFGLTTSDETKDEKQYSVQNLNILTKKFQALSSFYEKKKFIRNPQMNVVRLTKTAVKDDEIYLYEASKKNINIVVYNLKGEIVRTIKDKAPVIKISDEEIKELTEKYSKFGFGAEVTQELIFVNGKKKDTVKELYIDKNGILWVSKTSKNELNKEVTVYSLYVNGVYTKDVTIPLNIEHKLFFKNDKIYAVYDGTVTVYEYGI
ncbi:MAG: hypothetical protein PF574_08440 [Candidatus Delongbacteria bacterium]|jgi:hypothetical protein|nr:hypothetical protein [Candidatus Delongbacteria bacterium]